jgi:hypothetical protein
VVEMSKEPILGRDTLISLIELSDSLLINDIECVLIEQEDGVYACKSDNKYDFRCVLDVDDLLNGTIMDDQITLRLPDETHIIFLSKQPVLLVEPII